MILTLTSLLIAGRFRVHPGWQQFAGVASHRNLFRCM